MAVRPYLRILTRQRAASSCTGLHGVGKSTWARESFPEAHIIRAPRKALLANPALLGLELPTPETGSKAPLPRTGLRLNVVT